MASHADSADEYQDRLYHGFYDKGPDGESLPRVLVEEPAGGPTQRERNLVVLYELFAPDAENIGGFNWGYRGGAGPQRVAAVVLTDALELTPPPDDGLDFWTEDAVLRKLRRDFVADAFSEACAEWRLRCTLVMRWARSWYLQHAPTHLPPRLHHIPTPRR
ncbi:hypothetical protein [Streptodolium elevatio]